LGIGLNNKCILEFNKFGFKSLKQKNEENYKKLEKKVKHWCVKNKMILLLHDIEGENPSGKLRIQIEEFK